MDKRQVAWSPVELHRASILRASVIAGKLCGLSWVGINFDSVFLNGFPCPSLAQIRNKHLAFVFSQQHLVFGVPFSPQHLPLAPSLVNKSCAFTEQKR